MREKRTFNTEGPCLPREHYMINAMRRLGSEALSLIGEKKYFVIHAARQTGKTTFLLELANRINSGGEYYAVYCSLENAEMLTEPSAGIITIINSLHAEITGSGLPNADVFKKNIDTNDPYNALQQAIKNYCAVLDKPLVALFDEADCLSGQTLISFLRQLRNGYINRSRYPFFHSLALAGMRNIRDYSAEYRGASQTLGTASPFNIVASYMNLRNFTQDEIYELYAQHASDTGQSFDGGATELVWEQTQGQPWLVNAIARETVKAAGREDKTILTADMAAGAVKKIITSGGTHFDSLAARLGEERVRSVIEPVIIGKEAAISRNSDDYTYVKDIGLIRDDRGIIEPANPIYGDMIIMTLNRDAQDEIGHQQMLRQLPFYLSDKGELDINLLLIDFQHFWRENGAIWRKKYDYQEAAAQLVLQAFLQRVVNGGGRIIREMAAATGRADICVIFEGRKYPIELKIRRGEKTLAEGVAQTAGYVDTLGCDHGWLVLFDQREGLTWEEKLYQKTETIGGKTVFIFGC